MLIGIKTMFIKAALFVCLVATPIFADTETTIVGDVPNGMTLTMVTENLYALTGPVGAADCDRIEFPEHPFTLILESPGGSLYAGICLANAIKDRQVITVVRDTPVIENGVVLWTPDPDGDGFVVCASACTLLHMAGEVRYLMGDVYYGIHGPGIPATSRGMASEAYTQGVQSAAWLLRLLRLLGVSEDVQLLILRIPSASMLYVKPEHFEEMEGLRHIANHYVNFWGYTGTNPHNELRG